MQEKERPMIQNMTWPRPFRPGFLVLVLGALFPVSASADTGNLPVGLAIAPAHAGQWAVMSGTYLKGTLEGWCRAAGWTLIWDSPIDYQMRASVVFPGGFEESAARLIDSIYQEDPGLVATFHRGNKVLHVQNQPLSSN